MRPKTPLFKHTSWFIRQPEHSHAPMRLFCFPYAGGSGAAYIQWQKFLPLSWEVVGIEPPGRASRFMEPAHTCMSSLINELIEQIAPLLDVPFAFFGHSNGALIAFELAREIQRRGLAQPRVLMLSAKNPPHIKGTEKVNDLPREAFVEKLRGYNGTPEAVWSCEELMDLVLPTLRADFSIGENYRYSDDIKLDLPVVVFAGRDDPYVDVDTLPEWQQCTNVKPQVILLNGGHFYFNTTPEPLLQNIKRLLNGLR